MRTRNALAGNGDSSWKANDDSRYSSRGSSHSRAKSAEISLDVDAEQVTIEIRDHGRGMPPHIIRQIEAETSKLGVGLAGMRERIHELGGKFVVSSSDRGTTVHASIPLGIERPTPLRLGTEHIV